MFSTLVQSPRWKGKAISTVPIMWREAYLILASL